VAGVLLAGVRASDVSPDAAFGGWQHDFFARICLNLAGVTSSSAYAVILIYPCRNDRSGHFGLPRRTAGNFQ
jgi:hypothetical protein